MSSSFHRLPLLPSFLLTLFVVCVQDEVSANKLLVIYMDALHWRYVDNRLLHPAETDSGFHLMQQWGAHVRMVQPVFPTQCLPNIYSSFTGRHPRYHGMLGSQVYEPKSGYFFDYHAAAIDAVSKSVADPVQHMVNHLDRAPSNFWNFQTELLWDTVAGHTGRPAHLYYLPSVYEMREVKRRRMKGRKEEGKEVNHVVLPYKRDISWLTFRNHVLDAIGHMWRNVTDFAVVYSDQLDRDGHQFGPDSMHVDKTMKKLDSLLHTVVHETSMKPEAKIHVMLMSDHGMQSIQEKKKVYLEWFIFRSQLKKVVNDGTVAGIWTSKENLMQVYRRLKAGERATSNQMAVYLKNDPIVEKYFGSGPDDPRLPNIIVMAKKGYVLVSKEFSFPRNPDGNAFPQAGLHGYHPTYNNMHTSMLVFGPKIIAGKQINSMDITQIYQLMCRILDVPPRPHNGSYITVAPMLKESQIKESHRAEKLRGFGLRLKAAPATVLLSIVAYVSLRLV